MVFILTWAMMLPFPCELTGYLAGACFYWLDGVLIRWLKLDLSLRLLVARRRRADAD